MIARRTILAAGLALPAWPALAIDPGTASGRYARDGVSLTFSHAVALALDNAEGVLDSPNRMRVLLSDAEVPVSALYGLAFPPVWSMAKAGAVRGLLVEFDPAERTSLTATVLARPEGGFSLATLSLSNSEGVWSRLDVAATRVAGALKPEVSEGLDFSFSAPVFNDAVQSDLRGPAVQASEPVKVLIARAEAIGRGDLAAAMALSTEASAANLRAAPPEALPQFRQFAPELIRQLKAARRVVIRRETAAVLLGPGEWASLARVDGAWKAAD
jgi:hypothetical protein